MVLSSHTTSASNISHDWFQNKTCYYIIIEINPKLTIKVCIYTYTFVFIFIILIFIAHHEYSLSTFFPQRNFPTLKIPHTDFLPQVNSPHGIFPPGIFHPRIFHFPPRNFLPRKFPPRKFPQISVQQLSRISKAKKIRDSKWWILSVMLG